MNYPSQSYFCGWNLYPLLSHERYLRGNSLPGYFSWRVRGLGIALLTTRSSRCGLESSNTVAIYARAY